uniref:FRIGIDA-like protein n=1 Tax=Peronospora matthiolae TaxID=2874970 RepID=A0AAV1UQE6_9STRA
MATANAIYESILTRVERFELQEQLQKVVQKDLDSVCRRLRRASSSITALRQLQAAAEHVRPSGDWLPTTLEMRLKSIEERKRQLVRTMDQFNVEQSAKKRMQTKRKRGRERKSLGDVVGLEEEEAGKEEKVVVVGGGIEENGEMRWCGKRDKTEVRMVVVRDEVTQQQQKNEDGLDVESLDLVMAEEVMKEEELDRVEVALLTDRENKEATSEVVVAMQDVLVRVKEESVVCENGGESPENEGLVLKPKELMNGVVPSMQYALKYVKEDPVLCDPRIDLPGEKGSKSNAEELTNGVLLALQDALVKIKEEPVMCDNGVVSPEEVGARLEDHEAAAGGMTASPSEWTIAELSDESAMELEVPDSESDEDFSPVHDTVTRLEKARTSTQLIMFPAAVDQLRAYLIDHKHMTVVEMDGYLSAHKPITDEEAREIGCTIETIISVALKLPMRPKIKLALFDLIATVEQLELTLGKLPGSLRL